MSRLQSLKSAVDLEDIARLLGFKTASLAYILYAKPPATRYTAFHIAKRKGGVRLLHAPAPDLKLLQQGLSELLQDCTQEIAKAQNRDDQLSHGFVRKFSIITNAKRHRRRRWVLNLDLEDFFGTINFGRVRGFFIKNQDFALPAATGTILAQIACHDNSCHKEAPALQLSQIYLATFSTCAYVNSRRRTAAHTRVMLMTSRSLPISRLFPLPSQYRL